jgi:glutamyl-tRNA reductase
MNPVKCISFNHRSAPVSIREKLILNAFDIKPFLTEDNESFVLSTCNRTEVYFVNIDEKTVYELFSSKSGLKEETLKQYSDCFDGPEALRHLFMVASGLDSLVLGEPQILGQVKDAYREALAQKTTSTYLNKAVHRAFRAAKRVRTETEIGSYPVSVASEAVELACHIFDDIKKSRVLIIGAGDMAGIAGKRLKEKGVSSITVINRTYENACSLAAELNGNPKSFDTLKNELVISDIIISSTGACEPIITKAMMADVMKHRKNREVIIIDIAVPRDVDPEAGKLYNCYLYDIDALKSITQKHYSKRLLQTGKALEIINYEVDVFNSWLNSLTAQETIKDLYNLIDSYAKDQASALKLIEQDRQQFESALAAGLKRLIHRPVSFLNEHPAAAHIEYARRLFKLDEDHKDRHKGQ